MKSRLIVLSAMAALALFLTGSAYADSFPITIDGINFNDMNCGNCLETNVLFGHPQQGPALHIVGTTVHGAVPIDFDSPTGIFANGGQSDIDPCVVGTIADCHGNHTNGVITSLTTSVSTPGGFFLDLILDPQELTVTGDLQATVHLVGGATVTSPLFGEHMHGNNFLTIKVVEPGLAIESVVLTSPSGFEDLKQPRISGVNGAFVPEPSSMFLLGSGVLGLAAVLRRKLLHSAPRNTGKQEAFQS